MFEKPEITKEGVMKIVVALIIASIVLLSLSILTDDNDDENRFQMMTELADCAALFRKSKV